MHSARFFTKTTYKAIRVLLCLDTQTPNHATGWTNAFWQGSSMHSARFLTKTTYKAIRLLVVFRYSDPKPCDWTNECILAGVLNSFWSFALDSLQSDSVARVVEGGKAARTHFERWPKTFLALQGWIRILALHGLLQRGGRRWRGGLRGCILGGGQNAFLAFQLWLRIARGGRRLKGGAARMHYGRPPKRSGVVEGGNAARMHFGRRPQRIPSISGLASKTLALWAVGK